MEGRETRALEPICAVLAWRLSGRNVAEPSCANERQIGAFVLLTVAAPLLLFVHSRFLYCVDIATGQAIKFLGVDTSVASFALVQVGGRLMILTAAHSGAFKATWNCCITGLLRGSYEPTNAIAGNTHASLRSIHRQSAGLRDDCSLLSVC